MLWNARQDEFKSYNDGKNRSSRVVWTRKGKKTANLREELMSTLRAQEAQINRLWDLKSSHEETLKKQAEADEKRSSQNATYTRPYPQEVLETSVPPKHVWNSSGHGLVNDKSNVGGLGDERQLGGRSSRGGI